MPSPKILICCAFVVLFISCSKPGPAETTSQPDPNPEPETFSYEYVPTSGDWDHSSYATGFSASKGSFFFDFIYTDAMVRVSTLIPNVSINITNKVRHDIRLATKATLSYRVFGSGFQPNSTLSVFANSLRLSRRNLIIGLPESIDLPQSVFKDTAVTVRFTFLLPRADPPAVFTATIIVTDISLVASN